MTDTNEKETFEDKFKTTEQIHALYEMNNYSQPDNSKDLWILKQLHDSDMILVFQDIFRNIEHILCGKDRIHLSKQYYLELKNKWIGLTPEEEKEYNEWKNKKKED